MSALHWIALVRKNGCCFIAIHRILTLLTAFSGDSAYIDLPASWPYLALPSPFANRPSIDDMLSLDIEPRGVYVAAFFNVEIIIHFASSALTRALCREQTSASRYS